MLGWEDDIVPQEPNEPASSRRRSESGGGGDYVKRKYSAKTRLLTDDADRPTTVAFPRRPASSERSCSVRDRHEDMTAVISWGGSIACPSTCSSLDMPNFHSLVPHTCYDLTGGMGAAAAAAGLGGGGSGGGGGGGDGYLVLLPTVKRPRRSAVWHYFAEMEGSQGRRVVCRLCGGSTTRPGGGTSNMRHHMRSNHPHLLGGDEPCAF
ncbi:Protein of unknown function [Gryllus bimaculatus]|nr:Protein of unknown function [Gryllus bimaculatus]